MGINASRHQESDTLFGHQEKALADSDVPGDICWSAFGTIMKDLMDRLVGKERLKAYSTIWLDDKDKDGKDKIMIHQDKGLPDSDQVGGSNAKSCAIYWRTVGNIMNYKYKCGVSFKNVCDEWSTEHIKEGGLNHRLSENSRQKAETIKGEQETANRRRKQREDVRLKRLQKEKADQLKPGRPFGIIDEVWGQAIVTLNRRGERLDTLSEKTTNLVNTSEDFLKRMKEIEKAGGDGSFW